MDRELLQDLLNMPDTSMIQSITVLDNGIVEFSVQDIAVPEVPGILETRPTIIDGKWSWNLAEALN